jgi:hypothetical protein
MSALASLNLFSPIRDDPHTLRSWTRVYNLLFPDPTFPPRKWELDVAGYLFERRYHVTSIQDVLAHVDTYGSIECCIQLAFDARDRAKVESLLPDAHESAWARHDEFVWAI